MEPGPATHASFAQRLQTCANKVGSAYQLARTAGLHRNTLGKYLRGTEPPRDNLIKIARAAGVSVEWLAVGKAPTPSAATNGSHPETDQNSKANVLAASTSTMSSRAVQLRDRLRLLVSQGGGAAAFCRQVGLAESELTEALEVEPLALDTLAKLASHPSVPIRWLLSGDDADRVAHTSDAHQLSVLAARFAAVDDQRTYAAKHDMPLVLQASHERPKWKKPLFDLLARIYEWLPPARYELHIVDYTTMRPTLDIGDVAVINRDEDSIGTGYYLFNSGSDGLGKPTPDFIARAIRVGGKIQLQHSDHTFAADAVLNETDVTCLGRVALIIKRSLR